jgi:hypothetical protein
LLASCDGGDGSGVIIDPVEDFDPVYSAIQANVFTPNCATSGCHFGAGAPFGLRLDEANSYGLLVSQPSKQVPALFYVLPGDPDNSYLIRKLEGSASVGAQMPIGRNPLPQQTIEIVRQWIVDGAQDDRAGSSDPVRITSLSPLPGSVQSTLPQELIAVFDREVDASTVNLNTFTFWASGGDGVFTDGNETAIPAASITLGANGRSAIVDLGGATLVDDTYQVRLLGSGPSMIMDLDANALDGEFSGLFPSGNGAQGGDFVAVFSVQTGIVAGFTLDEIQTQVFDPSCAFCHSGPAGPSLPGGLDLSDADASFTNLVDMPSRQVPLIDLVEPGDADNSYLIQKLEGSSGIVGAQMPAASPPLDQDVIDGIRAWIDNGAQR